MAGKNNLAVHELKAHQTNQTFALRKLSVGVASVLVGTTLAMWSTETVHADTSVGTGDSQADNNTGAKLFDDSTVNGSKNVSTSTADMSTNAGSTGDTYSGISNNVSNGNTNVSSTENTRLIADTGASSVNVVNATASVNNNAGVVNNTSNNSVTNANTEKINMGSVNVSPNESAIGSVSAGPVSAEANENPQRASKENIFQATAPAQDNKKGVTSPVVHDQDVSHVSIPDDTVNSSGVNPEESVRSDNDGMLSYSFSGAAQQFTPQQLADLFATNLAVIPGPVRPGGGHLGSSSVDLMSVFTDALGNKWHYSVDATVLNSGAFADNYHKIHVMLQSVDISPQSQNANYLYIPGGHVEDPNTAGFMDNVYQAISGELSVDSNSLNAESYSWSVSPELVNYVANHIGNIKFGWLNAGNNPVSWAGVFSKNPSGQLDHLQQNKVLKSVDMSALNLDNVTNLMFAFNGCSELTTVDFGNWEHNMTNLTNVKGMFNGCEHLESIKNLGHVHFDHVVTFDDMFLNCHRLNNLDLGTLRVFPEHAESAESMFSGCGDISLYYGSGKFVIFDGPGSSAQNGMNFDFSKANLKNTKYMFANMPLQWISIEGKIPSNFLFLPSEGMFDGLGYHTGAWNETVSLVDLRKAQIDDFEDFMSSQKFRNVIGSDNAADGSKINYINPMLVLVPESMANNQDASRRMVLGSLTITDEYGSHSLFSVHPGSFVSLNTASAFLVNDVNKTGVPIKANKDFRDPQVLTNFDSNFRYLMDDLKTDLPDKKLTTIYFTTLGDESYYIANANKDLNEYFSNHSFIDALNDDSFNGGSSFEEFRQRYRNAFSGGNRDAGVYAMLEIPGIKFVVKDTVQPRTLNITYVDSAGHQIGTQSFTGKTGEHKSYVLNLPKGYQYGGVYTSYEGTKVSMSITDGVVNVDYDLAFKNPRAIITVEPVHVKVVADHPYNNGTQIPNSDKTFHGVTEQDLNRTQTIRIAFNFDGHVVHGKAPVEIHRDAEVNAATGEVTYDKWEFVNHSFPEYEVETPKFDYYVVKDGTNISNSVSLSNIYAKGDYIYPVVPGGHGDNFVPNSDIINIQSLGITPDNLESREWVVNLQPQKIAKKIKFVDDQSGNILGEKSIDAYFGRQSNFDLTGLLSGNLKGYDFDQKTGLQLFNWNEIDQYLQVNSSISSGDFEYHSGIILPTNDYNQLAETGILSDRVTNITTDNNKLVLTIVPNSTSPEILVKVHHKTIPINRNVQVNWTLKFKNTNDVPAEYRGAIKAEVVNSDGSTTDAGSIINEPTQVITGTVHGTEDLVTGEIKWDQRIDFSKSPLKAYKVRSPKGSVVFDDYSDTTVAHYYTEQNQSSSEYGSIKIDNGGFSTDFVPADGLLFFDWINNQMSSIAKNVSHNEFIDPRIDLTTYLTFHKYEMNTTINYRYKGDTLYTQTLVGNMDTKFKNPYKAPKGFIIKPGQNLPMNFNLTDYAWQPIDVDLDLDRQINFRYVDYNNLNNSPMQIDHRNADMSDLDWDSWKDHDLGNKSQLFTYIGGVGTDGQSNYASQEIDLQKLKSLGYDVFGEQSPRTFAVDNVTTSPDEYKQRLNNTYDKKFAQALQRALSRWHEQVDPIKNKINTIQAQRQEQVNLVMRDDRKFATLDPASEALHKLHDEVLVAHNKISDYDERIRILNNQLSQINFDDFLTQEVKPMTVVMGVGHLYDVYSADNTPKMSDKTSSGRTINDVAKVNGDAAKLTSVNSYGTYHTRHIEVNIVPGPTGLTWPLAVNEGPVEAYQNKTYGYFTTDDMSDNGDFEAIRMPRQDHYQYDVTLGHGWIYTLDNATGQVLSEEMDAEDASNFTMYLPTVPGYDLYVNDQKVNGNYFKLDQSIYGQPSSRLVYNVKYVPHSATVVINVVDQHGNNVGSVTKPAYIDSTLNIGDNFGQNFANDYNMQHPNEYMEVDTDDVPSQFSATPDQEGKVVTYTVNTHIYPLQNVEQDGDKVMRKIIFMHADGSAGRAAVSDTVDMKVFKRTYTNDQGQQVELPNVNGDDEYVYQAEGAFADAHSEIYAAIGTNNYQIVSGLQWVKAYTPYSKADTGVITVVY